MDIIFDTETTGLDPERDEILTLSAVDGEGNVLWDRAYRPARVKSWPEAEAVNGISPESVAANPEISEDVEELRELFGHAERVVGYNVCFDLAFLAAVGVEPSEGCAVHDTMRDFAEIYGEVNEERHDWRWKRLSFAAEHVGHDWEGRSAHGSLADALATLDVQRWCDERRSLLSADRVVLEEAGVLRSVPPEDMTLDELWIHCCALSNAPITGDDARDAEAERRAKKMFDAMPHDARELRSAFERSLTAYFETLGNCPNRAPFTKEQADSFVRLSLWNCDHAIARANGVPTLVPTRDTASSRRI